MVEGGYMSITLHLMRNPQQNITTQSYEVSYTDLGDDKLTARVSSPTIFQDPDQDTMIVFQDGNIAWRGFVGEVGFQDNQYTVTAYGDVHRLRVSEDYNEFWSDVGFTNWNAVQTSAQYSHDDIIDSTQVYATLRKGANIPRLSGYQAQWVLPLRTSNVVSAFQIFVDYQLPTNYRVYIQTFTISGVAIANYATLTGNDARQRAIVFGSNLDSQNIGMLRLFLRNDVAGAAYNVTAETDQWYVKLTDFRALGKSTDILTTTLSSTVSAGTGITVTPASMNGIYPGSQVLVSGGASGQIMTVQTTTPTTFVTDTISGITSGTTLVIPRIQGSTIAQSVVAPYFLSTTIPSTNDDVLYAQYENISRFDVVASLLAQYNWSVHAGNFVVHTSIPMYKSRSTQTGITYDLYNSVGAWRGLFQNGRFRNATAYVTASGSRGITLLRTRAIDYGTVVSGLMLADLTYQAAQPVITRSNIAVTRLLSATNGKLSPFVAIPPANVEVVSRITNFFGLRFAWPLRQVTITDSEVSYVLDEFPDSIESYLAGVT